MNTEGSVQRAAAAVDSEIEVWNTDTDGATCRAVAVEPCNLLHYSTNYLNAHHILANHLLNLSHRLQASQRGWVSTQNGPAVTTAMQLPLFLLQKWMTILSKSERIFTCSFIICVCRLKYSLCHWWAHYFIIDLLHIVHWCYSILVKCQMTRYTPFSGKKWYTWFLS